MKRRKIKEMGSASRGMYIRNADIMPDWSDICNTGIYRS